MNRKSVICLLLALALLLGLTTGCGAQETPASAESIPASFFLIGKHITLYSKAGIGGDIEWFRFDGARVGAHNKVNFRLGFQVTPIGINFGKGPVRFFSEIGYGSAAVLTAGVSCYLGKVKR